MFLHPRGGDFGACKNELFALLKTFRTSYYYYTYIFLTERVKTVNQELYNHFRTVLNERKKTLLEQANQTVNQEVTNPREHLVDYADIATLESDRTFHLRIRDRERKLIKKIDDAMKRIEEGTFGFCERCGEEITLKRLEARPVTTYCIHCKTKLEEKEID